MDSLFDGTDAFRESRFGVLRDGAASCWVAMVLPFAMMACLQTEPDDIAGVT